MVTLIKDILPKTSNFDIITELSKCQWGFACDNDRNDSFMARLFSNKGYGFNFISLINNVPQLNTPLNTYGKIILDLVLNKLNFKGKFIIHRFYWNMYHSGNYTEEHVDGGEENLTILYNLHTTDGGTEINKIFYKDLMGEAKVFKSNILHKGIPPKEDKIRFNLNIVLTILK
jgi:hypothetical protein